jgi:mRNA interferase RelE/StbE
MACRLRISDDIVALIRGLHPILKRRVRSALTLICRNPYEGKTLKEEMIGLRSFRIKRFRIIYEISSDRTIGIIALGPRKRIYAETYRILKKKQAPSNVKRKK